jgi:signal transduction histidine kinase
VVPINVAGQFWGGLTIFSHDCYRRFSPYALDNLDAIATYLGCAIQKLQTQQQIGELIEENCQLKDNCQNKSDFLSHINHELRTPLAGILGFAKMLREEIYGALNDKQKQYVQGIAVSGEHLLALVNDFLDLSKIEANREELYWETVAVEDVCLAALAIVQGRAKEQGLELLLDVGEEIDFCTVDQRRVKQILLNLLSNALKFTETGFVQLRVRMEDETLQFCVIDTGIGIKESDRQLLFQPFQQIDSPLSRKHKGTGLGLALSRKLAQLHGGDLTVTSTLGEGSCFTLNLPCYPSRDHNQG